jgi:hypothetical protein
MPSKNSVEQGAGAIVRHSTDQTKALVERPKKAERAKFAIGSPVDTQVLWERSQNLP